MEVAYLAKGIVNLRKLVQSNDNLKEYERGFRQKLLAHLNKDHALIWSFDPYAVSKLLRYMLTYNDASDDAIELYKSMSLLLTKTVEDRQRALINASLDDPLIDLEVHDLVDVLRVYSAFANQATLQKKGKEMISSIPPLFADDKEADEIDLYNAPSNADLGEMSLKLLKTL